MNAPQSSAVGSSNASSTIVILAATRTPLGAFQGSLASAPAWKLGATAIRGAVAQAGIASADVSDVLMGNVLQAGQGQAPARQAALAAGLPPSARAVTISKVCGSGLQAVMQAAHALAAGDATLVVAGGMENMSAAPYLMPKAREGYRLGNQQVIDSLVHDGLWDPYNNLHMGNCAEQCAKRYSFTREQQDAYAIATFQRANTAQKSGAFAAEITPVELTDARGNVTRVEHDEGPAKVNYDKLPTLRPAFDKAGTITAANASTLNDGAAALVLTTAATAGERGLKPVARIVSFGSHAHEPLWFTTAPVQAAQTALQRAGWSAADVDLWEVNEAFAVVPMAFAQEIGVPPEKLNVNGGAIALGHPIGASGARIIVTLLAALRARGLKRGVAAICIGGGEGLAICVELL
ncbi:thiolase family protein [Rariglobus hedericola]|uniref:Thiolase family protein n=1 Tax=Rariglobus hedericola TaxID=2597822 RepID=A0A556QGR7_9BACT|nr:thiolase family protein [Rariglobus hedericola]TSJ75829.1 thiolase family protein [Rariglobus hedericola]